VGLHTLSDPNDAAASVQFRVAADGTVTYDPALEGVLTGAGTRLLTVHGATVTVDTTRLSTAALTLDGALAVTRAPPSAVTASAARLAFTALPGVHTLTDPNGTGAAVSFTLAAGNTVKYEPRLEGVLTGAGTSHLTVRGATVTVDVTRLSTAALTLDGALTVT